MKKLSYAVAVLAFTHMGCIIVDSNEGSFDYSWTVTQDGNAVSFCADVEAAFVETAATDQLSIEVPPLVYLDTFACDSKSGRSRNMPLSDYVVSVFVSDSSNQRLAPFGPPPPATVTLTATGQPLLLGEFAFITPLATVTFTVDYGVPNGNNCATGEAVVAQETTLTVSPAGLMCTDTVVSFDGVSTGCTNGTCDTCALNDAPCAEFDVVQAISGLPDGAYQVQINGLLDCGGTPTVCFAGSTTFDVIAGGAQDLAAITAVRLPQPPCNVQGACL